MSRFNPWIAPAEMLTVSKAKRDYVPSHERAGFSEKKVIKLPAYGEIQQHPGKHFTISSHRPVFQDRGRQSK